MRIILTTLGRLHFVPAASALIRRGLDLHLFQGWLVKNPEKSFFLKIASKIVGRKSLIYGFTKRSSQELNGRNHGEFWGEFATAVLGKTIGRLGCRGFNFAQKTGLYIHGWLGVGMARKLKSDLLHVRSGSGHFLIPWAHRKGMKVLVDHSAGAPQYITEVVEGRKWDNSTFWWTVMQDCDSADLLMVDCDFVKSTFLRYGYPEEKIRVVYMGLDQKFNGLRLWNEDLSNIGRSPDKPLRIVFTGVFALHKGSETFLGAIDLLLKTDLHFEVTALGSAGITPEQRQRYPDALAKIDFRGHVPQDEMVKVMQNQHIYLFPSLSEGCAKSAFEAMSMGLCVVCTFETGLPMTDGVDGYLIQKNNPQSIVDKISWLVEHPESIAAAGRAATETLKKYTWDFYAENVEKIYKELMSEGVVSEGVEEL